MNSFKPELIKNLKLSMVLLRQISSISEYTGKEALYRKQGVDVLDRLLEIAKIQSAESSNRIEGILVSHERAEAMVLKKSQPRDRSEEEFMGYKDVLELIHDNHEGMDLSVNLILMLHSRLYRRVEGKNIGGDFKRSENEIIEKHRDGSVHVRFKPVSAFDTPNAMDHLVKNYLYHSRERDVEPLVLIALFILDFLCIHPFMDGNGRMSRLLTLLLLYQSGYQVGKYISIERIIETEKEAYYQTLHSASQLWHQSQHDLIPWMEYFCSVLNQAYIEFESRMGVFNASESKTKRIHAIIHRFDRSFTAQEVHAKCPEASLDLIRKVLKEAQANGSVRCFQKGRYAKWVAIPLSN